MGQATIFDQVQQLLGSVTADNARERIAQLDTEIEERKLERQKWFALLSLKQQLGESPNGASPEAASVPTLRRAIFAVMNQWPIGSEIPLSALRAHLVKREWLTPERKDAHRLQMMASDMVKRGQLGRPRKGFYQLPSQDAEGDNGGHG